MKKEYQQPRVRVIHMAVEPICAISGQDYTGIGIIYDADSD